MKPDEQAAQLREDFLKRREEGTARGRGYPVAVRERVLAYMDECRKRKETVETVAKRLGMSPSTLSMWIVTARRGKRVRKAAPEDAAFAPVKVSRAAAIVLTSPAG